MPLANVASADGVKADRRERLDAVCRGDRLLGVIGIGEKIT